MLESCDICLFCKGRGVVNEIIYNTIEGIDANTQPVLFKLHICWCVVPVPLEENGNGKEE